MKVLSVNKVLEVAGSPVRLQRLLYRAGQPYPSLRAIYGWKLTRVIPAMWQAPILWAFACTRVDPFKKLIIDVEDDTPAPIRTEFSARKNVAA